MLDANEIVSCLWQGAGVTLEGTDLNSMGFKHLILACPELKNIKTPQVEVFCPFLEFQDGPPLTQIQLNIVYETSKFIAKLVREKQKTLVCCAAGINRSGLLVALALRHLFGFDGQTAINFVRMKRIPTVVPMQPLNNQRFCDVIINFNLRF